MNNLENINEELKKVAPGLLNQKMELGHHTPEGYFDLLPEILLVRKEQDVAELGVMPGYFEKMQDEVINQIKPPTSRMSRIIPLIRTLSVAASVIVLFGVGYLMMNPATTVDAPLAMEISTEEAMEFLGDNIADLDLNSLVESGMLEDDFLTDEDINLEDSEINNILDELEDVQIQDLEDFI